jgi:hypothetical protein
MRFQAEHWFPASVGAVADLLVDADFHRGLSLPDVELLDVVEHRVDGDDGVLSLRYAFVGRLDPVAQRLLGGQRLTWTQQLGVDRATGDGRLAFAVDGSSGRLRGAADFTLQPHGEQTVWELRGELRVRVPLVGGTAERHIVAGLLERLELEARHMTDRLHDGH